MLAIICALGIGSAGAQGVDSKNYAFQTDLKTLVVFKEGFGFYLREGSARLENGWATTNLIPQAARGSLWIYPLDPNDRVDTIITTNDNRIEFDRPEDIQGRLADKVGLRLRIVSEGDITAVGMLTHVLDDMLLLREKTRNILAVEYKQIKKITLTDFPVRIKLRTDDPNGESRIGIAYIQAGVRWEPSYLLEILPDNMGRITLRGTLLDLPEELKSANLVFVIGAPSVLYMRDVDKLLQGFMSGFVPEGIDQIVYDPVDNTFVVLKEAAEAPGGGLARGGRAESEDRRRAAAGLPPVAESGELQYYTKPNFSLRPGERAMTTIFEAVIPVTPFFEWNADGEDVTYIVKLKNTSEDPFTLGPVFVVEDKRPVGQQNIEYTAPGDEAELRMAQAIGLKVERREIEDSRADPFEIGKRQFLPITMKGTLTLENFRDSGAEVRITRTVSGKVLDIGGGGKVKDTRVQPGDPNSIIVMEWTVTVPPGEKVEITYRYETYTAIGNI